jgi:hypothetical protein
LAVGVLFGGVAAGIPEASIAGAVTLAIGWNSEFSGRNCRVNAVAKNGNEQMEKFCMGNLPHW